MRDEPLTWHFGLMAESWAAKTGDPPELPFFQQEIAHFGQPVLDVACGTGRLLLPLLRAGIDVDGCDISADMLQYCRRKAKEEGFHPQLIEVPMDDFEMHRRYKTIYICDSFGLAGSREKDLATLRRCYDHLDSGGVLLVNIQAEYTLPQDWGLWLQDGRQNLPEPWPREGYRRLTADGSEIISYFRMVDLDPLEQRFTRQVRLEKRVEGALIETEEYTLRGNMYFKNEVMLMLQIAGFNQISVRGDYSDEPPTATHEELVFTAIK